ncbi:MarR family winged helix-turn-helix transcriptional regulator [Candidimonas nitroreducens]|uniref:MarR family transcriptional regulator n=1 Tax=Candidimonas nitroreducens TaxID=683354 RepID=A0A225N1K4_9BURK|nr:MarR family transcriptional regulator [Candidimonas nitroreducens]OWT65731.1 MarR family transcriptional regulator [Candidimonas nitroreducens]
MSHLPIDLENYPGYHIRRLQQIAVAVFLEETEEWGVTPVQYGALSAVSRNPDIGQRTLARLIGLDTSTIGSVVDRLEARELMARKSSPTDRRTWLLSVTPQGRKLLKNAEPCVLRAQQRMLDPLPQDKRQLFMEMLAFLTTENDKLARSPSATPTARPRKKA